MISGFRLSGACSWVVITLPVAGGHSTDDGDIVFVKGAAPDRRAHGVAQSPAGVSALLAGGNLKPSAATELVRLSPRGQDTLFNAIRTGGCRAY